ncbi:MAG TPA: putative sporulation protein YtxC [Bacillota bacterium]|nr:putative sporulation protein YtxC [Bacillota bacterium]
MKLFKIILGKEDFQNVDAFRNILYSGLQQSKEACLYHSVKEILDKDFICFHCQFWPTMEHTFETQEYIRKSISTVIAEYIVEFKEEEALKELLAQEFGYDLTIEQHRILDFIHSILQGSDFGERSERIHKDLMKKKIMEKAMDYLWVEHTLTLDGFVRFRLKEQWEEWRLLAQQGIEEYLADEEYKEFIGFVRFCLSAQEAKTKLLHIVHIDDQNLQLFNEGWQHVSTEKQDELFSYWNQSRKNYEDLLLSELIYIAPEQLIIHTDQEQHHIIYTLKRIFDKRVNICHHCSDCCTRMGL